MNHQLAFGNNCADKKNPWSPHLPEIEAMAETDTKKKEKAVEEVTTLGKKIAEGEEYFAVAHIFASFNDTFVVRAASTRPHPTVVPRGNTGQHTTVRRHFQHDDHECHRLRM